MVNFTAFMSAGGPFDIKERYKECHGKTLNSPCASLELTLAPFSVYIVKVYMCLTFYKE